jgi:hypothetical protein
MGKMKREYESLVSQGLIASNEIEDNVQRKYSKRVDDVWNIWDTDDRGDNRVDFERVWESL